MEEYRDGGAKRGRDREEERDGARYRERKRCMSVRIGEGGKSESLREEG